MDPLAKIRLGKADSQAAGRPTVAHASTPDSNLGGVPLSDLAGWGQSPVVQGYELRSEDLERITKVAVLSRGLGRSYGDSSLPPPGRHLVAATPLADRLLAFDADTGIVRAEAGVSLRELNRVFLPRGWFTAVTPGTHYVTLGGMVAADVHGKSHHRDGCFGEHVRCLRLRVADGRMLWCSDQEEPELFRATLGGMGLTGHILEVEFTMRGIPSPWIWQLITHGGPLIHLPITRVARS